MTQSHPEKNADDLEGSMLPGIVKRSIEEQLQIVGSNKNAPVIFAIGGLEISNCHEPVLKGADGVAVIRSVMQASNPPDMRQIKECMYERGNRIL